ncbi:unnamed protein product, partial [Staurois parvus]
SDLQLLNLACDPITLSLLPCTVCFRCYRPSLSDFAVPARIHPACTGLLRLFTTGSYPLHTTGNYLYHSWVVLGGRDLVSVCSKSIPTIRGSGE